MCVFPLFEEKQRFMFRGVMSTLNTHSIPMFWLRFSSFMRQISVKMLFFLNFVIRTTIELK